MCSLQTWWLGDGTSPMGYWTNGLRCRLNRYLSFFFFEQYVWNEMSEERGDIHMHGRIVHPIRYLRHPHLQEHQHIRFSHHGSITACENHRVCHWTCLWHRSHRLMLLSGHKIWWQLHIRRREGCRIGNELGRLLKPGRPFRLTSETCSDAQKWRSFQKCLRLHSLPACASIMRV